MKPGLSVEPLLVGGSGIHSYDEHHPKEMPTALEAGTLNVHGLAGWQQASVTGWIRGSRNCRNGSGI